MWMLAVGTLALSSVALIWCVVPAHRARSPDVACTGATFAVLPPLMATVGSLIPGASRCI